MRQADRSAVRSGDRRRSHPGISRVRLDETPNPGDRHRHPAAGPGPSSSCYASPPVSGKVLVARRASTTTAGGTDMIAGTSRRCQFRCRPAPRLGSGIFHAASSCTSGTHSTNRIDGNQSATLGVAARSLSGKRLPRCAVTDCVHRQSTSAQMSDHVAAASREGITLSEPSSWSAQFDAYSIFDT